LSAQDLYYLKDQGKLSAAGIQEHDAKTMRQRLKSKSKWAHYSPRDGELRQNNISVRSTLSELLLRAPYGLKLITKSKALDVCTCTVDNHYVFQRERAVFDCDGAIG
jgi:hypothetical protein